MLRVGVMLDSYVSTAWIARVLEEIQASGFARLELVLVGSDSCRGSSNDGDLDRWGPSLFHRYERWDYRRNKADDDATTPVDVSRLIEGIPSIVGQPGCKGFARSFTEDQLARIRSYNLDVFFYFGRDKLEGGILDAARCGVWTFQHGRARGDHARPPLFGELAAWNPISESSMQMLTGTSERRTIYQSYSTTDQFSLYGSRNPIYWKTAEFAVRGLRDLHRCGIEHFHVLPGVEQEGARGVPSNLQMALFLRRYLSRWLHARRASLWPGSRTRWYMAIRPRIADRGFGDTSGYKLMLSPADRFYADPFLIEKDGKTFLFFEDFRYADGRAVISCCELGADGTPGSPFEVLARPYHLSYPFVFEHEGEMYMIPETKESGMVELYRATSFPTTWVADSVLLNDVHAVDATIQQINGKFWMFAGLSNGKYSNSDELWLFFADELRGPWKPHPANPVVSDVRRARPAGKLFYDKGRLIRPSQDCSKAYGYALVFSEVLTLSETEYKERPVARINPETVAGCAGTHTFNRTEKFEVVDRTLSAKAAHKTARKQASRR